MLARNYTDRIQIWNDTETADGFGGFTNTPTLLQTIWAKKTTKGASFKFQQLGLNDFKQPVIFSVRGMSVSISESNYIIFAGKRFNIKSIEDVNLDGRELNILCDSQ